MYKEETPPCDNAIVIVVVNVLPLLLTLHVVCGKFKQFAHC